MFIEDSSVNLGLRIKNPVPVLPHKTLPAPLCPSQLLLPISGHMHLYTLVFFWGSGQ